MPANSSSMLTGYLAGRYPGRIGWLLGPDGWREPHSWLTYACDNNAYADFCAKRPWDESKFYSHIDRITGRSRKPIWIAVPDVVSDRESTLRQWFAHSPRVAQYGCPLAFVAQDGMTPDDIPPNASIVFIGGSTKWKWANLRDWTGAFPRVHVGRVGSERMLWMAHEAGAESCDGTGWLRGGEKRAEGLIRYLEESTNGKQVSQLALF